VPKETKRASFQNRSALQNQYWKVYVYCSRTGC